MSAIQELIAQLNQTTEAEAREKLSGQIISLIRSQDTVWAAFCPATKHYFIAKDEKQLTAYLFSEQEYYQAFADSMRKKHIILDAAENQQEQRLFLFAELYRCGVTQVVVDNDQNHASVPLSQLVAIPDYSTLPLVQRPVLNPAVTGKIICFMQDIQFRRADGNAELEVFQEIYHSPFLMPIIPKTDTTPEQPGIYHLPDGQQFLMIFTDLLSLKKLNPEEYRQARIVRFGDFQKFLQENAEIPGIIINPGSGAPMLLDRQLLEIAEKFATGAVDQIEVRSLNEDKGKTIVTKPEVWPQDLVNQMTVVLENETSVKTAYLRAIRRDEDIRPHYLIVIDWEPETAKETKQGVQRRISEASLPYARGLELEFISYHHEIGKEWAGSSEPFYQKKQDIPESTEISGKSEKKKGLFGFFRK